MYEIDIRQSIRCVNHLSFTIVPIFHIYCTSVPANHSFELRLKHLHTCIFVPSRSMVQVNYSTSFWLRLSVLFDTLVAYDLSFFLISSAFKPFIVILLLVVYQQSTSSSVFRSFTFPPGLDICRSS